jgi:hypothetical protein
MIQIERRNDKYPRKKYRMWPCCILKSQGSGWVICTYSVEDIRQWGATVLACLLSLMSRFGWVDMVETTGGLDVQGLKYGVKPATQ